MPPIERVEPFDIEVDSDERVEQVKDNIDGFSITELLLSCGVLTEKLSLSMLLDDVPLNAFSSVGTNDLDDIGVVDL